MILELPALGLPRNDSQRFWNTTEKKLLHCVIDQSTRDVVILLSGGARLYEVSYLASLLQDSLMLDLSHRYPKTWLADEPRAKCMSIFRPIIRRALKNSEF